MHGWTVRLACLAAWVVCFVGCAGHAVPAPKRVAPAAAAFSAEAVDISVDWEGAPAPSTIGVRPAAVSLTASDGSGLRLASLDVRAVLYGPLAFTELHLSFENTEDRQREGTFSIALPHSAAVSRFAMRLPQGWQEAEVVEQQVARATYERFLHRNVDPALLEKDTGNVFRGRVFPIAARTRKDIVIAWTEELPSSDTPYRFPLRGLPVVDQLDVQLLVRAARRPSCCTGRRGPPIATSSTRSPPAPRTPCVAVASRWHASPRERAQRPGPRPSIRWRCSSTRALRVRRRTGATSSAWDAW